MKKPGGISTRAEGDNERRMASEQAGMRGERERDTREPGRQDCGGARKGEEGAFAVCQD